jgi:hypothetical protein
MRVELLAVAELIPQPRADPEPVRRVDGQVPFVKHRVHVRPERQPVVDPVLPAFRHRPDVGRLEYRPDLRPRDGTVTAVGVQHDRLERLLREPVWREARIAEHRSGVVPRSA